MPDAFDIPQVEHDIDAAEEACADARAVRHAWRWKSERTDRFRVGQINDELENLRKAMVPIRSYLGLLIRREPLPDQLEGRLRAVSKDLQYQRRSLKRMMP